MLPDWELWAAALHVRDRYGDGAVRFIAKRVSDLARKGDVEGVAAWNAIAHCLDQLTLGQANLLQ